MKVTTVAVVDYGMGNFHSVLRALRYVAPDTNVQICKNARDIDSADRVVLPGQGAARDCMYNLNNSDLSEALLRAAAKKPILGICIGKQILFENSQEGNVECLGLFSGSVRRFDGPQFASNIYKVSNSKKIKIPHIGWNAVNQTQSHFLWSGIPNKTYFYFVHSYYVVPDNSSNIFGTTEYGFLFPSAIASDNIFAVQFHPEKSSRYGLMLYRNFIKWNP